MSEIKFPTPPSQVYRATRAEATAFGVGVALRIVWEVSKSILLWTLVLGAIGIWSVFYIVVKILSAK